MKKTACGMSHAKPRSRRSFLKMAAGGAVATAGLAAMGKMEPAYADDAQTPAWDHETDVVVIGYGGAGAIAAICAGEDGADVIVIEAAPIEGGGTSRMSGAYFLSTDDPAGAAEYLKVSCHGCVSDELAEAWAEGISQTRNWLTNHNIPWAPSNSGHGLCNPPGGLRNDPFAGADYPNLPHADAIDGNQVAGRGLMLYQFTNSIIDRMDNVEIMFGTRGIDLVQDGTTRLVKGVKALQGDKEIFLKARRGVIIASGGFSHNPDLIRRFMRPDSGYVSCEAPYNIGDGLKMAMKAGAALSNMTFACGTWPSFVTSASTLA